MCGIVGFIDFTGTSKLGHLEAMVQTLHHRGPDDRGAIVMEALNCTIGLGHTRLSILDLTIGGHQPMQYQHFTIVFNGEVYNFKAIRKELQQLGHYFHTQTDTEVVLHSYAQWGGKAFNRFIGMFAFAIYDANSQELVLVRDRVGVKPLYTYWNGRQILFGSELKTFHQHPSFEKKIDKVALVKYMQYGYVPGNYCIFSDAAKVQPGTFQVWSCKQPGYSTHSYWQPEDYYKRPLYDGTYHDAKTELHALLKDAFQLRMVSDVPVGVFLSGGYDSTAVAAILQSNQTKKLNTFTIGFDEGNNEAPYAKETASYLGTNHTSYTCTTREAMEIIPTLSHWYDEPFGDSSAIPTILVSRLAKEEVTVALSADGGDELLAGYRSYTDFLRYRNQLQALPAFAKRLTSLALPWVNNVLPHNYSSLKHKVSGLELSLSEKRDLQDLRLFSEMSKTPRHILKQCFSYEVEPEYLLENLHKVEVRDVLDSVLLRDYTLYLPDDILTKVDRATMSVSLEGREPLLDHRILEFAASLPIEYKWRKGTGKILLKDIVHEYVPKEMMDRPKTGFSLPIYSWLRGDLSWLLEEYLSEEALQKSGVWNVKYCTQQIKLFKHGKMHYSPFIWYLLMFQMWQMTWANR